MAQTPEQKLVKAVVEALDNHWFNPALFADIITTDYTVYTQNKLIELVKWIIRFEQRRFEYEWDTGMSSNELLQADALADVLKNMEPGIDTRQFIDSLPVAEAKEVDTSWVHRIKPTVDVRVQEVNHPFI
jgi:hypothetical protein